MSPTRSAGPTIEPTPLAAVSEINFLEPDGIVYAFKSLWVPMDALKKIQRIDPVSEDIVATITKKVPYEAENPKIINGLVWVSSAVGGLAAFDPRTNSPAYRAEGYTSDVAYGDGHYWLDDALNNLLRLDPDTGQPTFIPLTPYDGKIEDKPNAVSFEAGSVWVGLGDKQVLYRIDPATLSISATFEGLGYRAIVRTIRGRTVVFSTDGQLHELDTHTNEVIRSVPFARPLFDGRGGLVEGGGRIWINYGHVVYSLDPDTFEVLAAYEVTDDTWGIAYVDGTLWIPFYEKAAVRKFQVPGG